VNIEYRSDIDGLRAIAIIPVILSHIGIKIVSGGYVGVDIFFVISGYLITSILYKEISGGTFSYLNFYKRRAARLLPALGILLFSVTIFGGVFYNNEAFDSLGKDIFFSSIGAANILYADGVNYFATEEVYRPLLHIWSLGVEEQFYLIWPTILCITFYASKKLILPIAILAFVISLSLSVNAVSAGHTKSYFLLHYRAFELLAGAITFFLIGRGYCNNFSESFKQHLSLLGFLLMIIPMFTMDKDTQFPGFNALWPCIGASLLIALPNNGPISRLLSSKGLVFIGLISYPLYLYHQPIISFVNFFDLQLTDTAKFLIIITATTLASWLTYRFIEKPIRKRTVSKNRRTSVYTVAALLSIIPVFATAGIAIAKTGGFQERFKYLNPFAYEISNVHSGSFHRRYGAGYKVSSNDNAKALFVGDSMIQQYTYPLKQALDISNENIDTVTRGACVLLKNTQFIDRYADISCNELKRRLYENEKFYDYVVISQAWAGYNKAVTNFDQSKNDHDKWQPFLNATIEYFLARANYVIVISAHPHILGTDEIQPSLFMKDTTYTNGLVNLEIKNKDNLIRSTASFDSYRNNARVVVIDPYKIFCQGSCTLSNESHSYFRDYQHLSNASNEYVRQRLESLIAHEFE